MDDIMCDVVVVVYAHESQYTLRIVIFFFFG